MSTAKPALPIRQTGPGEHPVTDQAVRGVRRGGQAGGVRLLSPQTVLQMAVAHYHGPDLALVLPMAWRLGYHSAFTTR